MLTIRLVYKIHLTSHASLRRTAGNAQSPSPAGIWWDRRHYKYWSQWQGDHAFWGAVRTGKRYGLQLLYHIGWAKKLLFSMHQFYQTHTDIRVLFVTTSLPVKFRVKCIEVQLLYHIGWAGCRDGYSRSACHSRVDEQPGWGIGAAYTKRFLFFSQKNSYSVCISSIKRILT